MQACISSLRAKGTLIGEPRFSTPCDMQFSHAMQEKCPFFKGFSRKWQFPVWRGKNCMSQGLENRGSLISVPLALRGFVAFQTKVAHLCFRLVRIKCRCLYPYCKFTMALEAAIFHGHHCDLQSVGSCCCFPNPTPRKQGISGTPPYCQ